MREQVTDRRRSGTKRRKDIYAKEWRVESRDNPVVS